MRPDPFANYNSAWMSATTGLVHTYDPTRECSACDRLFPYPRGGCGRRKDGRYPGDPKVKDETPTAREPSGDPWGMG